MPEPTIKPSDLEAQATELVQSGKMPKLDDVLEAVAAAREKYAEKIKNSRKHPADTLGG